MKQVKTIIILAGGDSTRLWPLSAKQVIPFTGMPFISHLVEELAPWGEKIIIVSHPQTESAIKQLFHDASTIEVVVQDPARDGLGGAINTLMGKVTGEALIVGAGDFFDATAITGLLEKSQKDKVDFAMLAKKVDAYFPGGYLKCEGERVLEVVEKPKEGTQPSTLVKLVVDYCADVEAFIQAIGSISSQQDTYELGINELIKKGKHVTYVQYEGFWHPLKYPWHILSLMREFLGRVALTIDKTATVSKHAIVQGPVYIGKNVKIGDFTKIVGPVYIGDNSVIGDYCMVRESQIGANCLIGGYSEVTRSYLADKVMLHRNYVGDSVLDTDVMFGAQAVTGNFRFDARAVSSVVAEEKLDTQLPKLGSMVGAGAKVGVNATILPGVKIGTGSYIGPGTVVTQDIPDKMFYHEGKLKPNKV